MKASLFAAALLLTPLAITGVAHAKPAAARTYDCSKPGNKTKAACKTAAASSTSSSAAASSSSSTMASAQAPKAKNYDCSKAGNKNKAVCKTTALASAPSPSAPAQPVTSKTPTQTSMPMLMAKPANSNAQAAATPAPMNAMAAPAGAPSGATAQCKDGTFSLSKHHSGSCSHHGGVAKWLS